MQFPNPPDPPARADNPTDYVRRSDAWAAWVTQFGRRLIEFVPWLNSQAAEIETASERSQAAANTAISLASAKKWESGKNYPLGSPVYSPVTLQSYRATQDVQNSTVDPSQDRANWQNITAGLGHDARRYSLAVASNA